MLIRYLKNSLEVGAIMSDQNIMFYGLNLELPRTRQIAGYNEDVLDALFVGPDESRVAVVTNTDQVLQ